MQLGENFLLCTLVTYLYLFNKLINLIKPFAQAIHRSSHREDVVLKKGFLKISQNSQESICVGVSFQCCKLYQKIDSGTGFPLWILRNFWQHLFKELSWATASAFSEFCCHWLDWCWLFIFTLKNVLIEFFAWMYSLIVILSNINISIFSKTLFELKTSSE